MKRNNSSFKFDNCQYTPYILSSVSSFISSKYEEYQI